MGSSRDLCLVRETEGRWGGEVSGAVVCYLEGAGRDTARGSSNSIELSVRGASPEAQWDKELPGEQVETQEMRVLSLGSEIP